MIRCILIILLSLTTPRPLFGIDLNTQFAIAERSLEGDGAFNVMVATRDGRHQEFIDFARSIGGELKFNAPELGYARVLVDEDDLGILAENENISGISIDTDGAGIFSSTTDTLHPAQRENINLDEYLKNSEPEVDINDLESIGLMSHRKNDRRFDGRGAVVAFIERFVDPDAEEMKHAVSLDGRPVKKILGMYEVNNYMAHIFPEAGRVPSIYGVKLEQIITNKKGVAVINGRRIRFPSKGEYFFGFIDERNYSEVNRDLNSDGNGKRSDHYFAIARNARDNCWFIDVNQNGSLSDDICLEDFNRTGATSRFLSPTKGRLGSRFWILETPLADWVVVGVPFYHTHTVVASGVGSHHFYSKVVGAGPGTQLISVAAPGPGRADFIEAFIRAAYDDRVDIICSSTVPYGYDNGDADVANIIQDRIVERKNKIIVHGAGNFNNMVGSINRLSAARNVLSVGQLHTARMKKLFFGIRGRDSSSAASSGGPLPDGRLKPDLIVPSFVIAPFSDSSGDPIAASRLVCPNLKLPPRGGCGEGTSHASPIAAGALASLISSLKIHGVAYNAVEIVGAVRLTAVYNDSIPVFLQGNGVLNVPLAFEYLRLPERKRGVKLDFGASVHSKEGQLRSVVVSGEGLFEREGWHPGSWGRRYITFKRLTGAEGLKNFKIRVVGDRHGTFTLPENVELRLGAPIAVPVVIFPRNPGVHSALLEVWDPQGGQVAGRWGMTVVAAIPLGQKFGYRHSMRLKSSSWRAGSAFFDLPRDLAAVKVTVKASGVSAWLFPPSGPYGSIMIPSGQAIQGETEMVRQSLSDVLEQAIPWPAEGVWEFGIGQMDPSKGEKEVEIEVEAVPCPFRDCSASQATGIPDRSKTFYPEAYLNTTLGMHQKGNLISTHIGVLRYVKLPNAAGISHFDITLRASEVFGEEAGISAVLFGCAKADCSARSAAVGRSKARIISVAEKNVDYYLFATTFGLNGGEGDIRYEISAVGQPGRAEMADTIIDVKHGKMSWNKKIILCKSTDIYVRGLEKNYFRLNFDAIGQVGPQRFLETLYRVPFSIGNVNRVCY